KTGKRHLNHCLIKPLHKQDTRFLSVILPGLIIYLLLINSISRMEERALWQQILVLQGEVTKKTEKIYLETVIKIYIPFHPFSLYHWRWIFYIFHSNCTRFRS